MTNMTPEQECKCRLLNIEVHPSAVKGTYFVGARGRSAVGIFARQVDGDDGGWQFMRWPSVDEAIEQYSLYANDPRYSWR